MKAYILTYYDTTGIRQYKVYLSLDEAKSDMNRINNTAKSIDSHISKIGSFNEFSSVREMKDSFSDEELSSNVEAIISGRKKALYNKIKYIEENVEDCLKDIINTWVFNNDKFPGYSNNACIIESDLIHKNMELE